MSRRQACQSYGRTLCYVVKHASRHESLLNSCHRRFSAQMADVDGSDLELRDAGVAFEALHLAPRLAAGGPGRTCS